MAHGSNPEVELTLLLRRMSNGDSAAVDEVAAAVYAKLLQLARFSLAKENSAASLQPTLLVNEAFLRLMNVDTVDWQDRQHFYLVASRMMRRILVDYFRQRNAQKRPPVKLRVDWEDALVITDEKRDEVLALNEALNELASFDRRAAQVVELRYFSGANIADIARILGIAERTVRRDWQIAQAWLKSYLNSGGTKPPGSG